MAHMYHWFKDDTEVEKHLQKPGRKAENIFYHELQRLDDHWTVFYSLEWFASTHAGGYLRDGEADFVVAHSKYGVFYCEVKGGVKIEAIARQWFSTTLFGKVNSICDPYEQGRGNKYAIMERFSKENPGVNTSRIQASSLAVFPQIEDLCGEKPLYYDRHITITSPDLSNLEDVFTRLYRLRNSANTKFYYDEALQSKFIDWLISKVKFNANSYRQIKDHIHDSEEFIIDLSDEQNHTIDGLDSNERVLVTGCAGSGKTTIAIYKAKELAQNGKKTLLCCISPVLGAEFEQLLSGVERLKANCFAQIINEICVEKKFGGHDYEEQLIFVLDQVKHGRVEKYDAILVDEEQDFTQDQLDVINYLLADSEGSLKYCAFRDSNQRLQHQDLTSDREAAKFTFTSNYRNTKPIYQGVIKHKLDHTRMFSKGPMGSEIKWTAPYSSNSKNELHQSVNQEVHTLLGIGFEPQDIVILTFKSKEDSSLRTLQSEHCHYSRFEDVYRGHDVRIESVLRFKGMDSKIVILTELDDEAALDNNELWQNMCYVALSRARSYLIIIPPNTIDPTQVC